MTVAFRVSAENERIIAAGLRWLYETQQPEGSIIQHHGISRCGGEGARLYSFTSVGFNGLPVIVTDVAGWKRDPVTGEIGPLLEPGEMAANAAVITRIGGKIADQWNGDGWLSGSFGLAVPAHPSLVAAVGRYRAGCPVHGDVFCGRREQCTWYRDGYALIIQPSWDEMAAVMAAREKD